MSIDLNIRLPLIKRDITLEEALDDEDNILHELDYPQQRLDFCDFLLRRYETLRAIVAHHLKIDSRLCRITPHEEWRHGSFNWCIPFDIDCKDCPRVVLRFPLPYKVGERPFPGNADEKLRCEVATYVYMQENCSNVPIPKLWGFSFSNGSTASIFYQCIRYVHDGILSILRCLVPVRYFRSDLQTDLELGYLLVDFVQDGEMLSQSFQIHKENERLRSNLFTDLSRILLSLGRLPQPRIGSFTIDNRGVISLSNRPLTLRLHMLENEHIPTNIDRSTTYSSVAAYVLDCLDYHDNRLIHQPNSMNDAEDGRKQMTAISLMRAISPQFINPETRHGPFHFTLTDLHQSNIFVDEDWHITSLIDLEWACSLPAELQQPPYWLTGQAVDCLTGDELDKFHRVREIFMSIFEREEKLLTSADEAPRTLAMQRNWGAGSFWFFSALDTTKGLYNIFSQNIQPRFSGVLPFNQVSPFWRPDTNEMIETKLKEREAYLETLKRKALESECDRSHMKH